MHPPTSCNSLRRLHPASITHIKQHIKLQSWQTQLLPLVLVVDSVDEVEVVTAVVAVAVEDAVVERTRRRSGALMFTTVERAKRANEQLDDENEEHRNALYSTSKEPEDLSWMRRRWSTPMESRNGHYIDERYLEKQQFTI